MLWETSVCYQLSPLDYIFQPPCLFSMIMPLSPREWSVDGNDICHSKTLPVKLFPMASCCFLSMWLNAEENEALANCWTQQTGSLEPSVTRWNRVTVMWMRSQCRVKPLNIDVRIDTSKVCFSALGTLESSCVLWRKQDLVNTRQSLPELTCPHFQAWMFCVLKMKILCILHYPRCLLTPQSDVSCILTRNVWKIRHRFISVLALRFTLNHEYFCSWSLTLVIALFHSQLTGMICNAGWQLSTAIRSHLK